MAATTNVHAGTRISGARLAVMTMARTWKPFAPRTTDNYTEVSAWRHRPT